MTKPEELEFWVDLNLPPVMCLWLKEYFGVQAKSFLELGFLEMNDFEVYKAAQAEANTIVITTKDIDFIQFNSLHHLPKILYINTGNISNLRLKQLVLKIFPQVIITFTETSQRLIEIIKTS